MEDQPVANPLPTQTQNNTDIHALSGIRTHDPSVRANEDIYCIPVNINTRQTDLRSGVTCLGTCMLSSGPDFTYFIVYLVHIFMKA
jgi:hypothetical protein